MQGHEETDHVMMVLVNHNVIVRCISEYVRS